MQGAEQPPHKKSHPAGQKLQQKVFCLRLFHNTGQEREKKHDSCDTLTGAVFSQVLVFALLFLSKRAAGLTALSGLAFTRHPPAMEQEI